MQLFVVMCLVAAVAIAGAAQFWILPLVQRRWNFNLKPFIRSLGTLAIGYSIAVNISHDRIGPTIFFAVLGMVLVVASFMDGFPQKARDKAA